MTTKHTRCTVLLGAPASGKTTWCATHAHGTILSLDQARAELGTSAADQTVTAEAAALTQQRCAELLEAGTSVTIDATSTTPGERRNWLDIAIQHGAHTTAVIFRASLAVCLRNNRTRDRHVPERALRMLWDRVSQVTPTQLRNEGFNRTLVIRRA